LSRWQWIAESSITVLVLGRAKRHSRAVVLHYFFKILSCLHNQLKFEFGDRSALPLLQSEATKKTKSFFDTFFEESF